MVKSSRGLTNAILSIVHWTPVLFPPIVQLQYHNLKYIAFITSLLPNDAHVDVQLQLGTLSEKKTGLCGKNSQTEGGGLTQTHFLMSTYQVIFGMPK